MTKEWIDENLEDYDKTLRGLMKEKKIKTKLKASTAQDKSDLIEAVGEDKIAVQESRENQKIIKDEYDIVYAEGKEW